jgi:hypothetical protein
MNPNLDRSDAIAYYQVLLMLLTDFDLLDMDAIPHLSQRLADRYSLTAAQHNEMVAAMEKALAPIGFVPLNKPQNYA